MLAAPSKKFSLRNKYQAKLQPDVWQIPMNFEPLNLILPASNKEFKIGIFHKVKVVFYIYLGNEQWILVFNSSRLSSPDRMVENMRESQVFDVLYRAMQ